jgi:hypothetical protein
MLSGPFLPITGSFFWHALLGGRVLPGYRHVGTIGMCPRLVLRRHGSFCRVGCMSCRQILSLWLERGRVLCGRRILPRCGAVGARLVHERLVLRDGRPDCRLGRVLNRLLLSSVERHAGRVSARLCVRERVDGGADRV